MAVPKRKQTPSRTGMRRAQNMKFSSKNIIEDTKSHGESIKKSSKK